MEMTPQLLEPGRKPRGQHPVASTTQNNQAACFWIAALSKLNVGISFPLREMGEKKWLGLYDWTWREHAPSQPNRCNFLHHGCKNTHTDWANQKL